MFSLFTLQDTVFKRSVLPASDLASDQKCLIPARQSFPIGSWEADGKHIRFSLGKDQNGSQITLQSEAGNTYNTWTAFADHVQITKEGVVLSLVEPDPIPRKFTFLELTPKHGQRDAAGCPLFHLTLIHNFEPVDRLVVMSGAPGTAHINPRQDKAGSLRPISEGVYGVGSVDLAPAARKVWNDAIGPTWIGLPPIPKYHFNDRGSFGIHLDYNRSRSPGTAGCIAPQTPADMNRIAGWCRSLNRPRFLIVNYGYGLVKDSAMLRKLAIDLEGR